MLVVLVLLAVLLVVFYKKGMLGARTSGNKSKGSMPLRSSNISSDGSDEALQTVTTKGDNVIALMKGSDESFDRDSGVSPGDSPSPQSSLLEQEGNISDE